MVDPTVLIVTNELDVGTDLVVRSLRDRGIDFFRLNTERLTDSSFTWSDGRFELATIRRAVNLDRVKAVLFRQPVWPQFGGSSAEVEVFQNQWRAVVRGLTSMEASWINPIDAGLAAESKILQLATAARAGLDVPATCVTNDLDAIRAFLGAHESRVVVKALDAPLIQDGPTSRFVFTSRLTPTMLQQLDKVDGVPMIFQEEITDKLDVRILMVDEDFYAFSIESDPAEVDWRRVGRTAKTSLITAPPHIIGACRKFLTNLGLRFGAFDFAVNADRYAFLECNQNGEWGWLQRATGAPVADTIVSALCRQTADPKDCL